MHRLLAVVLAVAAASPAWAQGVNISATVDQTRVDVGAQLTLTITIEGAFTNVNLKPIEFPQAFHVVAQSRSSNISLEVGGVKRSVSLLYVLMATEPGTFQLGPFQIMHHDTPLATDPIEITVNKSALPPKLRKQERYLL
ncbi:MAG: BatD family protein [Candidatus Omnitrophica bacterium]|nr:BatD family protein [Candidatus Omnitrophota bacterium]